MKLIIGLGNPGKKYEKTRHNIGFLVLDELHEQLEKYTVNEWTLSKKFNALVSGCTMGSEKVILAKPMTYMNASGQAVQLLGHFYKATLDDLIVVHDDKDLPLGEIRIQRDRGSAGHNGIKSIIDCLKSQNFVRVRIGIAAENEKKMTDVPKFVLGKFGLTERGKVKEIIRQSVEEIRKLIG